MGLINEPLDIDFYVDPRQITIEEKAAFSEYIKADKLKNVKLKNHNIKPKKDAANDAIGITRL